MGSQKARIVRMLLVLVAAATIGLFFAMIPGAAIAGPAEAPVTTISEPQHGAPNRDPIIPKPLPARMSIGATPSPRPGFP